MTLAQAASAAAASASHVASAVSHAASVASLAPSQVARAASVAAPVAPSASLTTNELWTLGVAVYAATMSTIVFLWDVYKWKRSGAQLRIVATTDYPWSPSAGFIDLDWNRTVPEDVLNVRVTAANIGDQPTTLTSLKLMHWTSRWRSIAYRNKPDREFSDFSTDHFFPMEFKSGGIWNA